MRNGTVTQSLRYMADAQTQLFKVLLRQWEQCSMWGSCWGPGVVEEGRENPPLSENEKGRCLHSSWAIG